MGGLVRAIKVQRTADGWLLLIGDTDEIRLSEELARRIGRQFLGVEDETDVAKAALAVERAKSP